MLSNTGTALHTRSQTQETGTMTLHIQPGGDLLRRQLRNFDRIESDRYHPARVDSMRNGLFQAPDYEWPGDTEGRTLLAWGLLQRATGRPARHLASAMDQFDAFTNSGGYFGNLADPDLHDEQQLAGHGWVLRALCELFVDTGDVETLVRIEAIVRDLALPTAGAHAEYPLEPAERDRSTGGVIGEPSKAIGSWLVSSDIGCDFIFLDGLAQAATLLHRPEIDNLVEEIIARFLDVDLLGIQAQTHATLTGIRALLRWHRHTGRPELLRAALDRFQLYSSVAMSESNANWNWFERPSHTEPCAIVDSFMIAGELWRITGDPAWLGDVHEIYYNGLGHAQRNNGGFGCDTVLGADAAEPTALRVELKEAWWCCTMRGAEGLAAATDVAAVEREGELTFPMFFSARIERVTPAGTHVWRAESDYPRRGGVTLHYESGPAEQVVLAFWVPDWAVDPSIRVGSAVVESVVDGDGFLRCVSSPQAGDVVEYQFDMSPRWAMPRNASTLPGARRAMRGPVLFGAELSASVVSAGSPLEWDAGIGCLRDPATGVTLSPVTDMIDRVDYVGYSRTALFAPMPRAD